MKAENLYKTVIQRQINKGIDEDNNGIIEMSLKLAKIYGEWKDHDKAKAGFDFCIKAQETKMISKGDTSEDTHALCGMIEIGMPNICLTTGSIKKPSTSSKTLSSSPASFLAIPIHKALSSSTH